MRKIAVLGATGYTGAELLRLLAAHPDFEVVQAMGSGDTRSALAERLPSLAVEFPDLEICPLNVNLLAGCDLVFSALPHGVSQKIAAGILEGGFTFVDLAADFRLRDPADYERWYGHKHAAPEHIQRFVYGLPELFRGDLPGVDAVAVPGCYPTAATLALAPMIASKAVQTEGIVINAASGLTGAGRAARPNTTFGAANENFCAYGLLSHRHTPEIQQTLGATVLFTPHLAPMSRGILATCYAKATGRTSEAELQTLYAETYEDEPFVSFVSHSPATRDTLGSNSAHVAVRHDPRTGWVVALCALDNLGKGAAGQAIQCANILCGLDETTGLSTAGVFS